MTYIVSRLISIFNNDKFKMQQKTYEVFSQLFLTLTFVKKLYVVLI